MRVAGLKKAGVGRCQRIGNRDHDARHIAHGSGPHHDKGQIAPRVHRKPGGFQSGFGAFDIGSHQRQRHGGTVNFYKENGNLRVGKRSQNPADKSAAFNRFAEINNGVRDIGRDLNRVDSAFPLESDIRFLKIRHWLLRLPALSALS